MKNSIKVLVLLSAVLFANHVNAQTYLGAFEATDLSIYASKINDGSSAELIRVDNFLGASDPATVKESIGAVYSQQYQQILAVYSNSEGTVIAQPTTLSENQPTSIKKTFGTCMDPNYNAWFAIVLTDQDRLVAIRLTY